VLPSIVRPTTAVEWAAARRLVASYAASLGVSLDFQNFANELERLSEVYAPPAGVFLLAGVKDDWIGCGALRRITAERCEMKRLYVAPAAQGHGVGRALVTSLIADARRTGYSSMVLDTLPSMSEAQALYDSLGFVEIEPYRFNPVEGTRFLKLDL
jgi:ribosomal protein S18 acetylase RimI-like enzyme